MAICEWCKQEMTTATACTANTLHIDGEPVTVVPWGSERGWGRAKGRCGDCGVARGAAHHPGCDIEQCPRCGGQLITCGCPFDEHPVDDEELDEEEPPAAVATLFREPERRWEPMPFGAAVAPLRARHRTLVADLASWALERGRPVDLDVGAATLDVLAPHRWADLDVHELTRPDVNRVLQMHLRNLASMLGTLLPSDAPSHVWTVISFLHATGRTSPTSDPLPALLEPLQCYGGLDPDGRPLPDDADTDFPCQCFIRHDPSLPQGMAQLLIGDFVVRAWAPPRSADVPVSAYQPLVRFARALRDDAAVFGVHVDDFVFRGRTDPAAGTPALSLYGMRRWRGRYEDLALDDHGTPYITKPDRRRKTGFRWVRADPRTAVWRCGAAALQLERNERRRAKEATLQDEWTYEIDGLRQVGTTR